MNTALLAILAGCFAIANSQEIGLSGRAYVFFANPNPANPWRVSGILDFTQNLFDIRINGTLTGLTAGTHGFHIHQIGDLGNGCLAAGPHYNPFNRNHGNQGQVFPSVRHVGDMANIPVGADGRAVLDITRRGLGLFGAPSIVGRTVIVHAMTDDLGQGGNPESLITGNAGARVACGIISRL